jgi:hypothetical protein
VKFLFFFVILFFSFTWAKSVDDSLSYPAKRTYSATRIQHIPKIDGILDDEAWVSEGTWQGNFLQQQPYEGQNASYPTEIKILYNTDYLFVAMRCYDGEPGKMRRIFNRRDVFTGDCAGIALDTYHDRQTAFEFNLTSAGQKIDLKHRGNYQFDQNWNAIWDGKTALEDSAWTAEFRIPFSQVRYSNKKEQVWGMHVWRWIDRKHEESQWQLIPLNAPAMVFLFGELNGIKNIRDSRQVELLPYGVLKMVPATGDTKNPYGKSKSFYPNAGFDAKIGISPNFTLDATVNPDFGQVEADPSVLNLTAYETFYEEKRPFFLEGDEIFDFSIDQDRIYYSRRIGQAPEFIPETDEELFMRSPENSTILGAAKITGKTSAGLSVGLLESVTSTEYSTLYGPDDLKKDTLVSPYSNFLVARIMQEKNQANTIFGGIVTATHKFGLDNRIDSLTNRYSYAGGVDVQQNFKNKMYFLEGKFMFSNLGGSSPALKNIQESAVHLYQRPGAKHLENRYDTTMTSLSGTAGYLKGGKKGGKWRFEESFQWRSPGFDLNDVGYLYQADYYSQRSSLVYREIEPGKVFRNYQAYLHQSTYYSFGGELEGADFQAGFENLFLNLWGSNLWWEGSLPSFETRELRGGPALRVNGQNNFNLHFHSNYAKDFAFSGGLHYRTVNHEPSQSFTSHIDFNWNPIRRIRIAPWLLYTLNQNEYQYIKTITVENDPVYLMGALKQHTVEFTLRAEVYFTPEISLQLYSSPYFSTGHYTRFHRVTDADAAETSLRYYTYGMDEITYQEQDNQYSVEEGNGTSVFTFDNPDFTFSQFRSNMVFRWEYKLGSVIYLVWSHNRTFLNNPLDPEISDSIKNLMDAGGNNIFLVKISYWFSV